MSEESNGLYYMRARYYDPRQGRFISEDPIGFESGEVNLFAYAGNNPMLVIDPLGLCGEVGFGENFGSGGYYDDLGMFRLTIGAGETASVSQLNKLSRLLNARAGLGNLLLFEKAQGLVKAFSKDNPTGFEALFDFGNALKLYSAGKTSAQVATINYERQHIQSILKEKSLFLLQD